MFRLTKAVISGVVLLVGIQPILGQVKSLDRSDEEIFAVLQRSTDFWEIGHAIDEIFDRPESWDTFAPELLVLLDRIGDDYRALKAEAVVTLGMMNYEPAVPRFIELLHDQRDWRLAFVAARSLSRLKAHSARAALLKANREHWYWGVRYATREALLILDGEQTELSTPFRFKWDGAVNSNERRRWQESNDLLTLATSSEEATAEERQKWNAVMGMADKKAGRRHNLRNGIVARELGYTPEALTEFTGEYPIYVLWLNSWFEPKPRGERFFFNRWTLPECGIRFGAGSLLGNDWGEWGGVLVYVVPRLPPVVVSRRQIIGIHRVGSRVVAIPGHAMVDADDWLLEVEGEGTVQLKTNNWILLPTNPSFSGKLSDGSLFIACEGGNMVISSDGEISEWFMASDGDMRFRYEGLSSQQ